MIDHDARTQIHPGAYEVPTFDELVQIGRSLGLVGGVERVGDSVRLQVAGQIFDLSPAEAGAMLNGVLLGYFAATSAQDLAAAQWR